MEEPQTSGLRQETAPSPEVSVVIASQNGRSWLETCISSILVSNFQDFEIIVVDNGSTDGSVEFIAQRFGNEERLRVIANEANVGWSPANNQGMRIARGDIIVCLSNDMEVDPKWLDEIIKALQSDLQVAIVQCNSLSMKDRKTQDSGMNYLDRFGFAYGFMPFREPTEVFFAEGMAFAVKRSVIDEIGMLDDYYFMEYDDIDFGWRARLAGYKVLFLPSAIVYHARGATVGSTYYTRRRQNIRDYVRNHFATLVKNYGTGNLIRVLPFFFAVQLAKIAYFLITGHWPLAKANATGLLQAAKDIKLIMRKRREVQRLRKVPDRLVTRAMMPFTPRLLRLYLSSQAQGRRGIAAEAPPRVGQ